MLQGSHLFALSLSISFLHVWTSGSVEVDNLFRIGDLVQYQTSSRVP